MLQKVGQIVCEARKCDLQFRACVLHSKEALHGKTLEGVAVLPHLIVLDLEGAEPRAIGGVLVALRGKDAPLGVGDVGFKHEDAIKVNRYAQMLVRLEYSLHVKYDVYAAYIE